MTTTDQNADWIDKELDKLSPFDNSYNDFLHRKPLVKATILDRQQAAINKTVADALLELKQEMKMHTVPEGAHLITRGYLNNSIDFKVAALTTPKERKGK